MVWPVFFAIVRLLFADVEDVQSLFAEKAFSIVTFKLLQNLRVKISEMQKTYLLSVIGSATSRYKHDGIVIGAKLFVRPERSMTPMSNVFLLTIETNSSGNLVL